METLTINIPKEVEVKTVKAVLKALGVRIGKDNATTKREKNEKHYNPEFVAKIQESERQYAEGRYTIIKTADLWK